jgi:hypothetical protein
VGQYNKGTVRVDSTTAVVKAIWELRLITVSGSFTPGNTVTWGVDGSGKVARWDSVNDVLYLYRESGATPLLTDTCTEGANTGIIDSFDSGSPPDYSGNVSVGDTFMAHDGVKYTIGGSLSVDRFTLNATFAGTTLNESPYAIFAGTTARRGYVKGGVGDVLLASMMGELADQIDTDFGTLEVFTTALDSATDSIDWTQGQVCIATLSANVTTLTFTPPVAEGALLILILINSGSWNITGTFWETTIKWPGGSDPTPSSSSTDLILFVFENTPVYRGVLLGADMS